MSKTLIVFSGKYDDGSAAAKRVRQFAMGLRFAGDEAAVVGYFRGIRLPCSQISWDVDSWGIPYSGVSIAEGALNNYLVIRDAVSLSSRLGVLAVKACKEGFDRVILYGPSWFSMRLVVKKLSQLGLPIVVDFNEWMLRDGRPLSEWIDQELFRRFCVSKLAGLVGISLFWEGYSKKVSKPMLLIPAMADDEFTDVHHCAESDFNLVYVGVLFRRDLPEKMLDGVRLAIDRGVNFKFHILGRPGKYPESIRCLKRIEEDPVLQSRVQVHGWLTRDQLLKSYSEASSFLLLRANDWESLACSPTRLPEYLSLGVPVIYSNTKYLPHSLKHGENIWLLSEENTPEELADAIGHLVKHRDERIRIGRAGRELALSDFFFEKHGECLKKYLDNLQSAYSVVSRS
jgi:glycosyltransferase involved in cell wall biosynthesis